MKIKLNHEELKEIVSIFDAYYNKDYRFEIEQNSSGGIGLSTTITVKNSYDEEVESKDVTDISVW